MAGRWRDRLRRRGRPAGPTAPASAAGPAGSSSGGVPGGGPVPGHSGGGGDGAALVASDMFTPGRAGGQEVLVWEGSVAAPASPLAWHSATPVEVFFHTGHHASTRVLAPEFTRQLDRQPNPSSTARDRKKFMDKVVDDLTRVHQLSWEDARARAAEVDRALVVLHESDQVTYGPSQPATTTEGWPSLGHGAVSSSLGPQNKPVATVLEQAALAVPADQRAYVRLLLRAVLTASPALAQDLRHGQVVLEPRTREQMSATSPRGPPWTPTHVAATLATDRAPWDPPPAQAQPATPARSKEAPAGADLSRTARLRERTARLRQASFPHPPTTAARTPPAQPQAGQPPQTGATPARPDQPPRPLTREEVLARITTQATQTAPHPTPDPHQKPEAQPRPEPLRPDPDLTR
ncbi:polymorphic toxin type 15 domain-containing protein [Actinomyces wuliandei]|uniref:polymorphic toxin type 15 domain-containing protein n=1 Tax=Actinomyces wuliandei TaxID=2057743 RepID=UPI000FDAC911|nr:polymorphic toxin type 15 domain-containing protein [Actinomyces wuliandei]